MSTKPVLYLDFDGVVNFFASRSKYSKHADTPHYMARGSVYADNNWYSLNWSKELVRKLNSCKDDTGFHWVWHTTWLNHTSKVDDMLGTRSDRFLAWDAHSKLPYNNDVANLLRDRRKYDALKTDFASHGNPFVWADDTATKLFNKDDFGDTPHLVLTPDPLYGLLKSDLLALDSFMRKFSP